MLHVSVLKEHQQALKYMYSYLCFKSCILTPDDGPYGSKYVAFINDIVRSLLCLKVTYIYIYIYTNTNQILICHSRTGWILFKKLVTGS